MSTYRRVRERHPREAVRRPPGSARHGCTFPVQGQKEILRVRDELQWHLFYLVSTAKQIIIPTKTNKYLCDSHRALESALESLKVNSSQQRPTRTVSPPAAHRCCWAAFRSKIPPSPHEIFWAHGDFSSMFRSGHWKCILDLGVSSLWKQLHHKEKISYVWCNKLSCRVFVQSVGMLLR